MSLAKRPRQRLRGGPHRVAVEERATAQACCSTIKEEVAMAEWLTDQLPEVTRAFPARSPPDTEAKR